MYLTPWVQRLLIANVAMYFLPRGTLLYFNLSFVPALAVQRPWTLITYMFLHAGLWHLLFNMIGLFFMGFGESLELILFGRIVSGIGIGTAVPAVRRIVILSDPGNLGRNLGRLLSAGVGGFALGPAVSAVLVGPAGLAAPFVVVAVLNLLFLMPVVTFPVEESESTSHHGLALDLLGHRLLLGALVLGSASFMMIGTFDALWDVVHEDLDTPTWMANLGITLFAVPLVVFGPVAGRWAQTYGPFKLAAGGLVVAAAFMFSYGQLPSGEWIFAVSLAHAMTDGLTFAAPGVAIAMVVDRDRQAAAQGLMGAAQSIVAGVTAIVMGTLYDSSGRSVAYTVSAISMAVFIAIGMGLAASFWTSGRHKAAATAEAVA